MEILNSELQLYAELHTSPENELLRTINRDTHAHVLMPRMLSGHLQGRVLAMISKMIRPRRVLEIGTYTGYSALCLAEGLSEDGKIITIDINEELEEKVLRHFAPWQNRIEFIIGNAIKIIPTLKETFDLVFIDADKGRYVLYLDLVLRLSHSGTVILADNVIRHGLVMDEASADESARGARAYNSAIASHPRLESIVLPILRDKVDGLAISIVR